METTSMISDILTMASMPDPDEHTYNVMASVDSIYPHTGWCYVTCPKCSKKIHSVGGLFICRICDAPCLYPMVRYSVNLCVSDPSNRAMFTLFNRQAEKLLDSVANKFYNRLDPDQFPPPLLALVGRHFVFKIRLPDYASRDSDFHNFRVLAMSEVATPLEIGHHANVEVGGPSKPYIQVANCVCDECELCDIRGFTGQVVTNIGVQTPQKPYENKKKRKCG